MIDSKVKDTLDYIAYKIDSYKVDRDDFANVGANSEAQILAGMIKDLEEIQDKLIGKHNLDT